MKKYSKRIFGIAIIIVIVLLIFFYLHVTGYEIDGASDISSECTVTITENYHNKESQYIYTLNEKQIEMVKTLILDSCFVRQFASLIHFENDTSRYSIRVEYSNGRDPLMINSIGNKYIKVLRQFDGKHLKNKNPNWEKTIEKIIEFSN